MCCPALPQIDYWKEQAGLPPHKRDYVDLEEIADSKQNGARADVATRGTARAAVLGSRGGVRCWCPAVVLYWLLGIH